MTFQCFRCGDDIEEPGALLLGPPFPIDRMDAVVKRHLCKVCYIVLTEEATSHREGLL